MMLESLVMGVANGTLIGVINYFAEESNAWKLLTSAKFRCLSSEAASTPWMPGMRRPLGAWAFPGSIPF